MLDQLVQAMHASCRFFGNAFDLIAHFGEPAGGRFHPLFDLRLDSDFFFRSGDRNHIFACFGACTQQNVQCRIAAIVQNQVRSVGELKGFIQIIPMFFQRLALDRENRRSASSNRRRCMVLGREDVA